MTYFYESHLGGIYTTDYPLSFEDLYCEECGDDDQPLGEARNFKEAWECLSDYVCHDGGYYLHYVFPMLCNAANEDELEYINRHCPGWGELVCDRKAVPERRLWECVRHLTGMKIGNPKKHNK